LYVPYPLQNNLRFFKKEIRERTLKEINVKPVKEPLTMKEWLEFNFGSTLCRLFFFPFHNLYTAGLYAAIAPQDAYKSPLNISRVIQGAYKVTAPAGYNATFIYPAKGLDVLVGAIARNCDVRYNKRIVRIDTEKRKLYFAQGGSAHYDKLISTLPLNKVMTMAGLDAGVPADPYTSVLVLNIGARRGKNCPDEHWLYIPDSRSGFHRVGFYSNVDNSFLPWSAQRDKSRVSIYVERAYPGGKKPRDKEAKAYADKTVRELQEWGFIKEVEVFDPTWIDVAYTWVWPGSTWREEAVKILKGYNIYQIGRYGAWKFQGIADSIKEGLSFSFKS